MQDDISKIRHVQSYDPVSAPVTSEPTRAIERRLELLEAAILNQSSTTRSSQEIIYGVPIRTDEPGAVTVNKIVFYNPSSGLYELAAANVTLIGNAFVTNSSALAVGIVLNVNGNLADILVGGVDSWGTATDRTNKQNEMILEGAAGFTPGVVYYLSDTSPGQLTRYAPALRIQVLVTSNDNYVVSPIYATPDYAENIYPVNIGMRPVGSVRAMAPDYDTAAIVAFDALENYDSVNNLWQSTCKSSVAVFKANGYMLADATLTVQPANPLYVRVQIDVSGNIKVFSANNLSDLSWTVSGGPIFNRNTSLTSISGGNYGTVRTYNVTDSQGNPLGSLSFALTGSDLTYERHVIFKFPDMFQGWKATSAAIAPAATAALAGGVISSIQVTEGAIGYTQPPTVVITDGSGTGASATAILNEFGTIVGITVNAGGTGYVAPTISFVSKLVTASLLSTGSGAAAGSATLSSGVITAVPVATPGSNYALAPLVDVNDATGTGALITATVLNGAVVGFTVVNGGTGYTSPTFTITPNGNWKYPSAASGTVDPLVSVTNQTTTARVAPVMGPAHIVRVDILSGGTGYTGGLISGLANGAVLSARVDDVGQIIQIDILNPGSGFTSVPNIDSLPAGGKSAKFLVHLGASIQSLTISNAGAGAITSPAVLQVGTPISALVLESGGSGYDAVPTVAITGPDIPSGQGGVQATATARIGGTVKLVTMTSNGSNYHPSTTTVTVDAPPSGVRAILKPLYLMSGSVGTIVGMQTIDPGSGYTSVPNVTITDSGGGSGAVTQVFMDSMPNAGLVPVVGFDITNAGNGYIFPPLVTITPVDSDGSGAEATVILQNDAAQFLTVVSGAGGLNAAKLQLNNFETDFPNLKRPQTPFYYNMKADVATAARYPAIPIDKVSFMFNGVEQRVSVLNESQGLLADLDADFGVSRLTLLWSTNNVQGCPWDAEFAAFVYDNAAPGRDNIIPGTAPTSDACFRLFEQTFKYEIQRNRAVLHLNKASRFYQTGRVLSLSALAPLRLIDVVTGTDSKNDGTPMTGQLMLVMDGQDVSLGSTKTQINLTNPGELQGIYINNTGRPVAITSVLLNVVFQTNNPGTTPDATFAAMVTVGTQSGNYRDIIGVTNADIASTRLYAINQVKELFPDADQPSPLIMPNDKVYIYVTQPAGAPIVTQVAVAYLKGRVL